MDNSYLAVDMENLDLDLIHTLWNILLFLNVYACIFGFFNHLRFLMGIIQVSRWIRLEILIFQHSWKSKVEPLEQILGKICYRTFCWCTLYVSWSNKCFEEPVELGSCSLFVGGLKCKPGEGDWAGGTSLSVSTVWDCQPLITLSGWGGGGVMGVRRGDKRKNFSDWSDSNQRNQRSVLLLRL